MAEEVAIRGASSVTVARVIARARVSRRSFCEMFADIEDCFLAAFNWGVEQARERAAEAYCAERGWRDQTSAGLAALLRFFDEQPLIAQLCIVHAAGGGPRVLARRARVTTQLSEVVDRARVDVSSSASHALGPVVAEGVVGAVLAVLHRRLFAHGATTVAENAGLGGADPPLIELHGELMSLILLPYLGANLAARELSRPAPPPPRRPQPQPPLAPRRSGRPTAEQPGARLTYRTVRVLRAIVELAGGSNREVAERAGIVDQGQISKILTRLEYQGLIVNRGGSGPERGTPNAWWLTDRGEALERELREWPPDEGAPGGRLGQGGSEGRPGKGSNSRRRAR